MRILIFSTDDFLHPAGGAETAIAEITKRLPDIQFDLICARLRRQAGKKDVRGNVTIHRIGFGIPKLDGLLLALVGARYARRLHAARPYDLVWAVLASYGAFSAGRFKARTGVPYLLTLQEGTEVGEIERKVRLIKPLYRAVFTAADGLQGISKYLTSWGVRMGFKGNVATTIPNGVDMEVFSKPSRERDAVRKEWKIPEDAVVVTTLSRLVPKNGVADLIDAMQFLPQAYLVIGGDGELRKSLERKVVTQNLSDRVRFLGFVDRGELSSILHASDVFARPSISEGLGNAFLEAMAARIPVVGTPVGGILDFLRDGETGCIAQPRDPQSIAGAIQRVVHMEPSVRQSIIENAYHMVWTTYTWETVSVQMEKLFKEVCRNT